MTDEAFELKYCSACHKMKSQNEFLKDKNNSDGLTYSCVKCIDAYNVYYRQQHQIVMEQKKIIEQQKKIIEQQQRKIVREVKKTIEKPKVEKPKAAKVKPPKIEKPKVVIEIKEKPIRTRSPQPTVVIRKKKLTISEEDKLHRRRMQRIAAKHRHYERKRNRAKLPLTQERLKEVLRLDVDTETFIWKVNHKSRKIGDVAGTNDRGRRYIYVDGERYNSRRLINLYIALT